MKVVVQRVTQAEVSCEGFAPSHIEKGFLALVGIMQGDDEEACKRIAKKLCGLRIFEDENGKTSLSLNDVGGSLLIVSQFTLCADCKKGYRPSFSSAAPPDEARRLFDLFTDECGSYINDVKTGFFGGDMKVSLVNDGPFTIVLQ